MAEDRDMEIGRDYGRIREKKTSLLLWGEIC
jgi:hypothetical protein